MDNNEAFQFTYSAQQHKEVEAIRQKYLPKEEDKMEQLRSLHRRPSQKAQAWAIVLGVIGALILGTGMSICMTEIGNALGEFGLVLGIVIGIVGMVFVALAYPVYNRVLKKERARIAPRILELTEELLK